MNPRYKTHTYEFAELASKAVLHLHNAFREVYWDFSEAFTTTVHYVVVTAAAGWADGHLRSTSP